MILTPFHNKLTRLTTKPRIITLFILAHLVLLLMMLFTFPKINNQLGTEAFDLKATGYSVQKATTMLQNLDQATVDLYLFPQLFLLDVLYPLLLALLLSALMIRLSGLIKLSTDHGFSNLYLLPFLAMVLDYGENILIALMITNPNPVSESIIKTASLFTQMKSGTTTLCWLVVIVLFVVWLVRRKALVHDKN
ncbi:MAG: hypothetical protein ABJH98_08145 [Reichenbachiella sp.]|uniref:hypothetical protein n=1 Tax=Reichenbachiella sp. TaxID=2184521 RepID=UPI0032979C7B